MKLEKIDLKDTKSFAPAFLDYLMEKPELKSFYNLFPKPENFKESIQRRSSSEEKRQVLHNVLMQQYSEACFTIKTKENIDLLLQDNTYTITTGHQLNIFTGPLYFIYKIITAINACKRLKSEYPECNFIPVYWMASEDHDFGEINHFFLYGNKYEWHKDSKGAVGRISPKDLVESIKDTPFISDKFKDAYSNNSNLANATREIVNDLFGSSGLVIIDPDNKELKQEFKDILKLEITQRKSFALVQEATKNLEDLGYKSQITPREINLFYLEDGLRERIEWNGHSYNVLNTTISFSEAQIAEVIESNPEKFSPNVVLRPVYQEVILPNLAYIGGPSEVVYWLQLKNAFEHYQVSFPMLMPRSFALIVNEANRKKLEKLNIPISQLFQDINLLKTAYLEENSTNDFHLNEEVEMLRKAFDMVKTKAEKIDKSLMDMVGAESHKVQSILEGLEKKLKKAEERNQEVGITQLIALKARLFPDGELQERHDNFLNFYLNDQDFIFDISKEIDAFDFTFNVFYQNTKS